MDNCKLLMKKTNWKYGTLEDAVNKGSSNISLNKIKDEVGEYPVFKAKGFAQNVSFFQQEKEYLAIIKDGAEFVALQKTKAESENSWSIDVQTQFIASKQYDLSAKNPNTPEEAPLRQPNEILKAMATLDKESTSILKTIKDLI